MCEKMNTTMITNIISKIKFYNSPSHLVLLGRWNIENSYKARNIKIDLANEDHCGACSQYRLKIIKTQQKPDYNKIIDIETVKY